jgi:hypothetical protein
MTRALRIVGFIALLRGAAACGGEPTAETSGDDWVADPPAAAAAKPSPSAAPPAAPSAPGTPSAAAPAAAGRPDPSLPLSKRIQGLWRMDLNKVPNTALTDQFLKIKKKGKAGELRIEYRVTDTEFTLTTMGERGPVSTRFAYEILNEGQNVLLVKRIQPDGKEQTIPIALDENDRLVIGTGNGEVPLERIELPENLR